MDEKRKEFVAKKKWDKSQVILFVSVAVALVGALAVVLKLAPMIAWLFIFVALSLYYMWNIFKAEYAYTLSNKLTVEILKSGNKRKSVYECFFSDITYVGKYAGENKNKVQGGEIINAATNAKDEESTYFALVERDGKKTALLFTPNEMMLSELKRFVKVIS